MPSGTLLEIVGPTSVEDSRTEIAMDNEVLLRGSRMVELFYTIRQQVEREFKEDIETADGRGCGFAMRV